MKTANEIQQRVSNRPFVLLHIRSSDGQSYDVYQSDLIMVGRRAVIGGSAINANPRQFEQITRI